MKDFKELKVWEKSHLLTLKIYEVTSGFPKEEQYGLTSQIRRASTSIGLNIAEGCGRGSNADFKRFLYIALGSACEVEYCLLLALDLHFISNELYNEFYDLINEVKRMLYSFIDKLK